MNALVLIDRERRIALFVKRSGKLCSLVRLASGTLRLERLTESQLWNEFREFTYPLQSAVTRFQQHGALHGMTQTVRATLEQLAAAPSAQLALL